MLQDFLNGVGSGLGLLLALGLLALFLLWIILPFLVLQLVRTNRALTTEVRRLRLLQQGEGGPSQAGSSPAGKHSPGQAEGDGPYSASEEGHHGE